MKVGDRVNLTGSTLNNEFWKMRKLGGDSIGTVIYTTDGDTVEVEWDNKAHTISYSHHLKLFEDEDVPLPNLKFKRRII